MCINVHRQAEKVDINRVGTRVPAFFLCSLKVGMIVAIYKIKITVGEDKIWMTK
jgi:hypothetical protein